MSAQVISCPHCGALHPKAAEICPTTHKALKREPSPTGASQLTQAERKPDAPPPPKRKKRVVETQDRDLIGKTIASKYHVRAVLGEGGMGTVYEAENTAIGRAVAVKVLHPTQAQKKTAVKRFHQEARAAGSIGHPNICEVFDMGTLDDGSPFLVMEKLTGETLGDRIATEGGLPFEDVIDVLTQVLSGLVVAHEKGIVHRDIKPENVFLARRVGSPPIAKLLDFGVSKMISAMHDGARDEEFDLTRTGMVMGTPYYMAPEQARGERILDARVDLYACGVILYEALTGRRPFTGPNYNALLLNILRTDPRPARELRPALPIGFDVVLARAMARSKDNRYRSAAEFQGDLRALRSDLDAAPPIVSIRNVDANAQGPVSFAVSSVPRPPRSSSSVPPPPAPPPSTASYDERVPESVGIPPSDPLLRLPNLGGDLEDEYSEGPAGMQPTELKKGDRRALTPLDVPTQLDVKPYVERADDWDDATTRVGTRDQHESRNARKRSPAPAPQSLEDEKTVKIVGDLDAHFASLEKGERG